MLPPRHPGSQSSLAWRRPPPAATGGERVHRLLEGVLERERGHSAVVAQRSSKPLCAAAVCLPRGPGDSRRRDRTEQAQSSQEPRAPELGPVLLIPACPRGRARGGRLGQEFGRFYFLFPKQKMEISRSGCLKGGDRSMFRRDVRARLAAGHLRAGIAAQPASLRSAPLGSQQLQAPATALRHPPHFCEEVGGLACGVSGRPVVIQSLHRVPLRPSPVPCTSTMQGNEVANAPPFPFKSCSQ